MKLKSVLIYLIVIVTNVCLGYLVNLIFNGTDTTNFVMFALGSCAVCALVLYIVSDKLGIKLDILSQHTGDDKHMLLNDIFAGILFSIPIIMFIAVLL